jgi:hypothetical protein
MELKNTIKERFEKEFANKRLLAVHLDGFSHSVIFDSGSSDDSIEQLNYSLYTSMSDSDDKLKVIFEGVSHYSYKHNATELLYVSPQER